MELVGLILRRLRAPHSIIKIPLLKAGAKTAASDPAPVAPESRLPGGRTGAQNRMGSVKTHSRP